MVTAMPPRASQGPRARSWRRASSAQIAGVVKEPSRAQNKTVSDTGAGGGRDGGAQLDVAEAD